ncbi:MAG: 50S ribosomal protein L17 [Anaplasmataceae bacterium]|nr:50S ribosomal protein L17 [Anaplasmataceae bacterium]
MRHKIIGRKFGRTGAHRRAMFVNMSSSLIEHGIISTTLAKAKELQKIIEPIITVAKKGNNLFIYRRLLSIFRNNSMPVKKLLNIVSPACINRDGGYTRVIKNNYRYSDGAPMAFIEFVDRNIWNK